MVAQHVRPCAAALSDSCRNTPHKANTGTAARVPGPQLRAMCSSGRGTARTCDTCARGGPSANQPATSSNPYPRHFQIARLRVCNVYLGLGPKGTEQTNTAPLTEIRLLQITHLIRDLLVQRGGDPQMGPPDGSPPRCLNPCVRMRSDCSSLLVMVMGVRTCRCCGPPRSPPTTSAT